MLLRACLLVVSMAGCSERTSVRLDMDAPGLAIASLALTLAWDQKVVLDTPLPEGGGPPRLPASVLLLLPDVDRAAEVTLSAAEMGGKQILAHAPVAIRAHQEVRLSMTLAEEVADLLAPPDLTQPAPPDFATAVDLAGVDLAGLDLAGMDLQAVADLSPAPDLKPVDPLVQIGPVTSGGATATASLPSPSRAGTLLLLTVAFDKGADPNGPAGWGWWGGNSVGNNDGSLFYRVNNPGGISSASAMLGGAGASYAQLSEWDLTNVDMGVWGGTGGAATAYSLITPATSHAGDVVLSVSSQLLGSAAMAAISTGGFTTLGVSGDNSALHYHFGYLYGVPSGTAQNGTTTSAVAGTWGGVLVAFYK